MRYFVDGKELVIEYEHENEVIFRWLEEDEVIIEGDTVLDRIADEMSLSGCDHLRARGIVIDDIYKENVGNKITFTEYTPEGISELVEYINSIISEESEDENSAYYGYTLIDPKDTLL